jgi:hypothetical protein
MPMTTWACPGCGRTVTGKAIVIAHRCESRRNRWTEFEMVDELVATGQDVEGEWCDQCAATSSIEEVVPGVRSLTVAHDLDCPILRASRARTN